jgi:excisionase family DNA binding protein
MFLCVSSTACRIWARMMAGCATIVAGHRGMCGDSGLSIRADKVTSGGSDMRQWTTVRQAAAAMGIREKVLYRAIKEGRLPCARLGPQGRNFRVCLQTIDEWLGRCAEDGARVAVERAREAAERAKPLEPTPPLPGCENPCACRHRDRGGAGCACHGAKLGWLSA